ncbi:MAG TPA: DUF6069 family protein [Gaiellaceae bacterium]|nr:DUF6069 family protein [Gaiellaceae bacterium]
MTRGTRIRIATVVLAPAAALAGWGPARLAGVDLDVSVGDGRVGAGDVVAAALLAALAAWVVVRVLERRTRQPLRWWPLAGSTALGASLAAPNWLAGEPSVYVLGGLHVLVAAVVISGFARTLPSYGTCEPWRRGSRPDADPAR